MLAGWEDAAVVTDADGCGAAQHPPTRLPVVAEWADARILLVDDETPIRRMLERLLVDTGYTDVHAFGDPREALAAYPDIAPDLTLLDLHMPGMHGTDVLRELATIAPLPRAPVIVMTGAGGSQDVRDTLSLGAADFLHKPVDAVELLLRVRYQLRERQLRRELSDQNLQLEKLSAARAGELAMLSRVLDEIPVIAAVLGPRLEVRYANALARRSLPWEQATLPAMLSDDASGRSTLAAFLTASVVDEPSSRLWVLDEATPSPRRVEIEAQRVEDDQIAVLIHDVEEQERATDALRRTLALEQRASEDLREVESLRTRFLSAVSHELRTPLTVVLGLAESLEHHHAELGADQRLELTGRLHRNAQRLGRLLDDLLDLNRLVDGRLETRPSAHDLAEIVGDAVADLDLSGHPLTLDVPCLDVFVEAARIQRVVANLVSNAAIHTPPGTPIRVDASCDDAHVRLRVVDRGDGVPEELRQRIFRPFEQGPSAPKHQPGTGIGLSLVQEFVRLHDGQVWVEETPGGGATFVVELPNPGPQPQEEREKRGVSA